MSRWGGVVIDLTSGRNVVFSGVVSQWLVDHWLMSVGQQIICQAEMYAALDRIARGVLVKLFVSVPYAVVGYSMCSCFRCCPPRCSGLQLVVLSL